MKQDALISNSFFFNLLDSYISLIVVKKSYKKIFLNRRHKNSTSINLNMYQV